MLIPLLMPSRRSRTMRRYLICVIISVVAALILWGCEASFDGSVGDNHEPSQPSRPTVPIKRRPIVPSTKLPRPRIIANVAWSDDNTLAIRLAEPLSSVEVVVHNSATGEQQGYRFEGDSINIAVAEYPCEVVIRAGDDTYSYVIGDI